MNRSYVTYLSPHELEVQYERLTLKDDFIFGKVMQEPSNCVEMLQRLTGNVIGNNISINNQKAIKVAVDGKAVRYDVYVEDEVTGLYDAEMQQNDNRAVLPKRSRFYQGLMDLNNLEIGDEYSELLDSYVIFICTFDPFDKGLCCYKFENICKGVGDLEDIYLGDGRKILIYNTKGIVRNIDKNTENFLKYIETGEICDDYTEGLERSVSKARCNKEWRVEYMKTFCHDADVRREGKEIGRRETLVEMVCPKLRKGKSAEVISTELDIDINIINHLCNIASSFAPNYDEDKILDKYLAEYFD
ncbi:MAG: Rpn family recombination-promoting nuclease/putative transposase [Lachnospiraceae bacterium]|nr:Rpn family recombination-promoting nuclease/putative transposase [Lachnospiraceae bacterium]